MREVALEEAQAIADEDDIPVEERPADEITALAFMGRPAAPQRVRAANPAFDVTPHRYVTGIITENGVAYPPFTLSLPRVVGQNPEAQDEE